MPPAPAATVSAASASPRPTPPSPGGIPYLPPPVDAGFDYQIGGDYPLPPGVEVVSRDWFAGSAPEGVYAICYVNAFQTQADEAGIERPDERSSWPADLVLGELGDDPGWGGEYLVDISTPDKRVRAAAWVEPMIETCRARGFEAVELDNLDSWTRFRGTPVADRVPFGRSDAVAYAEILVHMAHERGLAAARKNTPQLHAAASRERIGFDFAIAEECGRWRECAAYRRVFGRDVIVIEYRARDFRRTCRRHGDELAVVLRDVGVTTPGSRTYVYRGC
jgi:hypothetical protein